MNKSEKVSRLIDSYLSDYFVPNGRELTKEQARIDAIRERFGNVLAEHLSTHDVLKWVNALRVQELAPATIRRYVARLKAILNWGHNMGLAPTSEVRWKALDLAPEPEGRPRRVEEGELGRIFHQLNSIYPHGPAIKAAILIALDTGLRAGAILALRWGMVEAPAVLVIPRSLLKNKRASHELRIPLTKRLITVLQGLEPKAWVETYGQNYWMESKGARDEKVFHLNSDQLEKGWSLALERAGIKDLHFHDLRGEFATRLHEASVGIETISYLLDHATIEMTKRYIKVRTHSLAPAAAIKAMEALDVKRG